MPNLISQITSSIDQALQDGADPIAVFDADGTLWNIDIGLEFFKFQIKNGSIKEEDILNKVEAIYKVNPQKSCGYIVQLNHGNTVNQYKSWCQDYIKQNHFSVFSFQEEILHFLKQKGVQIYVVTASGEILIKEILKNYNLPIDDVVGVRTKIKDGVLMDEIDGAISFAEDKVKAFLDRCSQKPFFVSGNSMSDVFLLNFSSHIRFVVSPAKEGEKQFLSERTLLKKAKEQGWFYKDLS